MIWKCSKVSWRAGAAGLNFTARSTGVPGRHPSHHQTGQGRQRWELCVGSVPCLRMEPDALTHCLLQPGSPGPGPCQLLRPCSCQLQEPCHGESTRSPFLSLKSACRWRSFQHSFDPVFQFLQGLSRQMLPSPQPPVVCFMEMQVMCIEAGLTCPAWACHCLAELYD